ncbi:MAG: 6-carboxytetrahydropterin synthase [Chromatiales bacterium]|nr:6-carboxytetrahydropterin synthase [Chromatiales bacterium]
MQCLECGKDTPYLDNEHLVQCCGLTLHEYALRHKLPLDILVPPTLLNKTDDPAAYSYKKKAASDDAKLVLAALAASGMLKSDANFLLINGEVRRLDFLFWLQLSLTDYGFEFKQEYIYNDTTHRVVALNRLKTPARPLDNYQLAELKKLSSDNFLRFVAITIALKAELHGGYLFLRYSEDRYADWIASRLDESFGIRLIKLAAVGGTEVLLRSETHADSNALLHLVERILDEMPCTRERFYRKTPPASVTKELVFDAAHFITDHTGNCANLHGGRYNLHVTICDSIDPYNGFVMDYGYIKAVVTERVIKKLDHKSLNFSDSTLSWRSSTELLSAFIWQQLIDYLPNLSELLIYETDSSYCRFSGASLEDLQNGVQCMPSAFGHKQLGHSPIRRRALRATHPVRFDLVADHDKQ